MNKDEYYMSLASYMAKLSTCVRRGVGAVIVLNDKIISSGYNHTVKGSTPCTSETCIRKINNIPSGTRQEFCMATHAEQMAIIEACKEGYDLKGASIYVNDSPCVICARLICEFDFKKVFYMSEYPDKLSFYILSNANIETEKINVPEDVKKLIKIK